MASTEKTWAQLETDILETFRKWRGAMNFVIEWPHGSTISDRRKRTRATTLVTYVPEERAVIVRFDSYEHGKRTPVSMRVQSQERPVDNLQLIATTLEWMRMAEVRKVQSLVVKFYRQMWPEAPKQEVPPRQEQPRTPPPSTGPYAVLHLANDAPLEVAEAAYRALVKQQHPDVGGNHAPMVALNRAIEAIRAKAGK